MSPKGAEIEQNVTSKPICVTYFNYVFSIVFSGFVQCSVFLLCSFFSTIRMVLENNKNAEWMFWNNVSITNQLPKDYISDT